MSSPGADFDYIVGLIQFLDRRGGLRFFISTRDFDILYHWWEKGVPAALVQETMERVLERRRAKGRSVDSFHNFSADVRKAYRSFLERSVGSRETAPVTPAAPAAAESAPPELELFPEHLQALRLEFQEMWRLCAAGRSVQEEPWWDKLLQACRDDEELNAKCDFFLRQLAPELRRPEIVARYRRNFLRHRYAIPELECRVAEETP